MDANVLVGEYGCDLLHGYQLAICKKLDTIMSYTGGTTPSDIFLAPKDCASYVNLINTGDENTNNCKSIRAFVNGIVRIILYTSRKIKKR